MAKGIRSKVLGGQAPTETDRRITEAGRTAKAGPRRIQVSLSESNYKKLQAKAERTGTSMSSIAAIIIDDHLNPPTLDAAEAESLLEAKQAMREYRERIRGQNVIPRQ